VALAVGRRGARVGLVARSEDALQDVLDEIGGRGVAVPADLGDRQQAERAVAAVTDALGGVDVLVNNAGIGQYGPFADVDADLIEQVVRVNLLATLHVTRAVVPSMIERRSGHVVTVGSIAGRIGAPFESVYSATKFAQVGFTESLAVELAPFDISVSMVNPGPVATEFFDRRGHAYDRDTPRPVPPEAVADAIVRAVEKDVPEQVVPRWLRAAVVARHVVPPLYRAGTRRTFRDELRTMVEE
jgi:short-subunit dehydrogenase